MSGRVEVSGSAGQSAAATAHGGLVVVHGDAAARCAISLKGADVVVRGSVGHATAFMAQTGRLVVLGDAGPGLGDSIYETRVYVRGAASDLGADCIEKPLGDEHAAELGELLAAAGSPTPTPATSAATARPAPSTTGSRREAVGDVRPGDHRRDPAGGRGGHLRDPRLRGQARGPALRRPAVPGRLDVALSAGGLPRGLRHRRRPRRPSRRAAAAPRHPRDHRRDELRRPVGQRQGGARAAARRWSAPARRPATAA